ncbi:MAG: DUF1295 domain-containing protein [Brevinematales bacterium]|nr:DUF1295 domain-containing protein [Brevinematales bacterium]
MTGEISMMMIIFGSFLFTVLYMISIQPASLEKRMGEEAYKFCGRMRILAMVFEMAVVAGYILFPFGDKLNIRLSSEPTVLIVIGSVFTAATFALMMVGIMHAGAEAARPSKDSAMYGGIYRFMRHPQSLGEMLMWFGAAMILNSLTLLIYSIVWIPVFVAFNVLEENDLSIRFGEKYVEYTRKVGMFWPKGK